MSSSAPVDSHLKQLSCEVRYSNRSFRDPEKPHHCNPAGVKDEAALTASVGLFRAIVATFFPYSLTLSIPKRPKGSRKTSPLIPKRGFHLPAIDPMPNSRIYSPFQNEVERPIDAPSRVPQLKRRPAPANPHLKPLNAPNFGKKGHSAP